MTAEQRERLLRLLVLRQVEAPLSALRIAYWRLEKALVQRVSGNPEAQILDWLEAELIISKQQEAEAEEAGSALLDRAIELCGVLKS